MDLCPVFPPHFREQHVPSGEGRDLVNGYQPAEEVLYETYRDNESGVKYPDTADRTVVLTTIEKENSHEKQ